MSQIEICSRHVGEVSGVTFEDRGGIGYALVDEVKAAKFLKIPNDYWKPGQRNISPDAVSIALANDPEAAKAAAALLNGGKSESKEEAPAKNVAQTIELIKLCNTVEEVDAIIAGDERTGVLTYASKRKAQITNQ